MLAMIAGREGMLRTGCGEVDHTSLLVGEERLAFALIECADTWFDEASEECRNQVLVRTLGFSLNFRDKALVRHAPEARIIGSEFVGQVVACGLGVSRHHMGKRVIGDMSWPAASVRGAPPGIPTNEASAALLRLHVGKIVHVPETMPGPLAAGFSLGSQTAFAMVRRLGLTRGEHVLVTAATSCTSLFCIEALRGAGVRAYAVTSTRGARARLLEFGVHSVIELTSQADGFAEVRAQASAIGGFDAVIDPFADVYLPRSIGALKIGGRYVTCGIADEGEAGGSPKALPPIGLVDIAHALIVKNVTVHGNCLGTPADLAEALRRWSAGTYAPPVDAVYSGRCIRPFLQRSFVDLDRFGKVVFLYD